MADEQYRWLDRDAAERLLRGEPLEAVDADTRERAEQLAEALGALATDPLPGGVELPGEAAALAATQITDEELAYLETLVVTMSNEGTTKEQSELADRQFHITIARVTRNRAIVRIVESTWDLRYKSRLCMQMLDRVWEVRRTTLKDEHRAIVESLGTRDPKEARAAMQTHLSGLIENLLVTAELDAMEQTRTRLATKREEIKQRATSTKR